MANNLSLTVGATVITIPIKLTNVQLRAVIRRYALTRGTVPFEAINTGSMTEVQLAEHVLRSILREIKDVSTARQRAELLALQQAELDATLASDNDLYDEA